MKTMTSAERAGGVVQISLTGRMDIPGVKDIEAPFTIVTDAPGASGSASPSLLDCLAPAALRRPRANATARWQRIPHHHTPDNVCEATWHGT
jgi:hypothetical protein